MADYIIPWRGARESFRGKKLRRSLVHSKGSKIVSPHDGLLRIDEGTELGLGNDGEIMKKHENKMKLESY